MRRTPHVTLAALFVLAVAAPALGTSTDAALRSLRTATGIESIRDLDNGLAVSGDGVFRGSQGTYALSFDQHGRFAEAFSGALSMTTGYDGQVAWEVDWNQTPRALDLGDREEAILTVWLWTGQWLLQTDAFDEVSFDEASGAFRLKYGQLIAEVVLDAESGLPRQISYAGTLTSWQAQVGDYVTFDGVTLPARVDAVSNRSDEISIRIQQQVRPREDAFAERDAPPTNWEFDDEAKSTPRLKQAWTGHLLVRARINGERAGWFVFDSGAGGTAVRPDIPVEFDMPIIGRSSVGGAGGFVSASIHTIPKLRIGPVLMYDVGCVAIDLSALSQAWGVKVSGVIGYDLLSRTVVEMSKDPGTIAIYDRESYDLEGAEWQELFLPNRNAAVRASFEGHDGIFKLDTGAAASSVIFHVPAVEALSLLDGRETWSSSVGGIGGGLPALAGEIDWLEFGGRRFENVQATFATEEEGAFADRYTAGNIGGQLWGEFMLVFDYAGRRMAFKPLQD